MNPYKYFERSFGNFWGVIQFQKTPKLMSEIIIKRFWRVTGMIASTCGNEVLGYWTRQFQVLSEDVANSETTKQAWKHCERFRLCAREGITYQRLPENQNSTFKSVNWMTK